MLNATLTYSEQGEAYRHFEQLHGQAQRRKLWAALTGRRRSLLDLSEAGAKCRVQARFHGGLQSIPIDRIGGSEGRSQDFDVDFRPLTVHNRERWAGIHLARRQDIALPAVDLVQMGQTFFVRDGHHRISVARAEGQLEIEANVTVWQNAASAEAADENTEPRTPERISQHVGRALILLGERLESMASMLQTAQDQSELHNV